MYFRLRHTLPVMSCNLWWKAPKAPKERRTPWVLWTPSGSSRPYVRTTYWVRGQPGSSSGTPRCHPATLAVSWTGTRPSTPRWAWLTTYVDPQQHSQWKFTSYVLPLKKINKKVKLLLEENKKFATYYSSFLSQDWMPARQFIKNDPITLPAMCYVATFKDSMVITN